jgi:hypothetical protein
MGTVRPFPNRRSGFEKAIHAGDQFVEDACTPSATKSVHLPRVAEGWTLSRLPGKRARPGLSRPWRSNAPGPPDEPWFRELTDKTPRRGGFQFVPDPITAI